MAIISSESLDIAISDSCGFPIFFLFQGLFKGTTKYYDR